MYMASLSLSHSLSLSDTHTHYTTIINLKNDFFFFDQVNMRIYDVKIKKYLKSALETGDIIQVKTENCSSYYWYCRSAKYINSRAIRCVTARLHKK